MPTRPKCKLPVDFAITIKLSYLLSLVTPMPTKTKLLRHNNEVVSIALSIRVQDLNFRLGVQTKVKISPLIKNG